MIDVLVIGLGPAGACAAAAAARAGARVVAVDRRATVGVPVQCAELVPAPLAREVALAAVTAQPVRRMLTRLADEATETVPFPGWMIDRARFDASLVDGARRAGAECRFGTAVRAIARDGRVRLSTGESVAARVIVGADGPRSIAGRSACDRPYGDSPPSSIASYPFAPARRDVARIRRQLEGRS